MWAISVPENNLKYSKLRRKYEKQKKKINKLISTVSMEKENVYPTYAPKRTH